MSCFVVPDFHIDVIVSWACVRKGTAVYGIGEDPRELAKMLHQANTAAVRARYGEEDFPEYVFSFRDARPVSLVQIIKACDCLEYQCSDGPDWTNSRAARALAAIRDQAIRLFPGYESAAWVLDSAEVTA